MLPNWCNPPELVSCPLVWSCVGHGDSSPTMSHVIPLRLFQTLNLHRWNCNVLGSARKMTVGNYVRVLPGLPLSLLVGPAAWPRGLPRRHGNFACNSLLGISNFEFVSLELQRFWALLKVHAIELHAESLVCVSVVTYGHRSRSLLEARPVPPVPPPAARTDRLLLSG